jgi:hypothetical protein
MKLRTVLVSCAALALSAGSNAAVADSPSSDAAHMCLQGGPQIDYYEVLGNSDSAPPLDFGDLVHGADEIGPYIIAENHGDCVSFAAKNKGSKGGTHPRETLSINYTKIQYTSSSQ